MSYLSRRMREEGFWRKKEPGVLTFNLTVDTSRLEASFARASRVISDLAERAGWKLDPWQEQTIEALYADPDAVRRMFDPPPRRTRQLFVASTPFEDDGEILARLRDRAARDRRLPWGMWVDEATHFLEADEGLRFDREYLNRECLGIWPTPREDE